MADVATTILHDLQQFYEALDPKLLLFAHCLFCAGLFPALRNRFFIHYWTTFLAGFGGGLISGLLLGLPVALFTSNYVGICWTVSWWLMNCFPFDLVRKTQKFLPVYIVTKLCVNLLKHTMIYNRVDDAARLHPGVFAAALFCGTLGGCGGKFTSDLVLKSSGASDTPTEFTVPGFSWRSCVLNAGAYYWLVHIAGVMPSAEARALITTFGLLHSVLQDLSGRTLDFSWPIFRFFMFGVANVPIPSDDAAAPVVAAKAKAKTQ